MIQESCLLMSCMVLLKRLDDGSVRIWRSYTSDHCEIASAWKALSDRLPSTKGMSTTCHLFLSIPALMAILGSGLVLQWEQQSSLLFASGDVKHVVVWDAEKEQKVQVSYAYQVLAVPNIAEGRNL